MTIPVPDRLQKQGIKCVRNNVEPGQGVDAGAALFSFFQDDIKDYFLEREQSCQDKSRCP